MVLTDATWRGNAVQQASLAVEHLAPLTELVKESKALNSAQVQAMRKYRRNIENHPSYTPRTRILARAIDTPAIARIVRAPNAPETFQTIRPLLSHVSSKVSKERRLPTIDEYPTGETRAAAAVSEDPDGPESFDELLEPAADGPAPGLERCEITAERNGRPSKPVSKAARDKRKIEAWTAEYLAIKCEKIIRALQDLNSRPDVADTCYKELVDSFGDTIDSQKAVVRQRLQDLLDSGQPLPRKKTRLPDSQ